MIFLLYIFASIFWDCI